MRLRLVTMLALGSVVASAQQNADVDTRLREAESALEKQDYKGAEVTLKQLAVEKPKDVHILYDLGFAEDRNNEEDEAAKAYAAAFATDSKFADAELALGLLDARKDRVDAAYSELATVGAMPTATPQQRGRALRALAAIDSVKQPAKASEEILQAIQLTGETTNDTLIAADVALRGGDFADAEREYVKVLTAEPDNLQARVALGLSLRSEGKFADAEATLQQGLAQHPDDVPLVTALADVYIRENKVAEAIPLLETLRSKEPTVKSNVLVTDMLARMYAMSGRATDAEPLAREVARIRFDDPKALDGLGSVLVKEMKYAEAERVLAKTVAMREAFRDDAAWGEAASHLAFAASKNKDPQVTLQTLAARATVLPNSPASLFLEATAHDTLHQKKEAERAYKAFLAIAAGKFPDEEFEARHRLIALQNEK